MRTDWFAYVSSSITLLTIGMVAPGVQAAQPSSSPIPTAGRNEIVVRLSPSSVEREGIFRVNFDANGNPIFKMPPPVPLVHGNVSIGGEQVSIYLPSQGPYSITTEKEHFIQNSSTAITVDANHDATAQKSELWYSSLPVRLGDQMFDVKAIDPGGTWIRFAKSNAPLAGAVVGKPFPPFQFTTTDREKVSLETYKGKWLFIDIWSFT